jgi:hypothetical protein
MTAVATERSKLLAIGITHRFPHFRHHSVKAEKTGGDPSSGLAGITFA